MKGIVHHYPTEFLIYTQCMQMVRAVFTSFLFLSFIFAANPDLAHGAGFAKQSLFLSQSTVTEGQTVFIYAVVTDESPNNFSGTLNFKDETGLIGKATISLEAGKATTASVSWTPKAGTHTVTATLTSAGDTVESQEAVFVINPKPVPADSAATTHTPDAIDALSQPTASSTTIDSSEPVVASIGRVSTPLASRSQPVFSSIDSVRQQGVDRLYQGTQWSKGNIAKSATAPSGLSNTMWLILSTLVLYICTAFAYLLSNIGIFYPAILFIFFLILWKTYKLFRR